MTLEMGRDHEWTALSVALCHDILLQDKLAINSPRLPNKLVMCPREGRLGTPLIALSQGHSVMGDYQGMKGHEDIFLLTWHVH